MSWLRQNLKGLLYLTLTAYWIFIFCLTHVPSTEKLPGPQNDKLAHFVAYTGLAFLLGFVVLLRRPDVLTAFGIVMTISLLYAISDEALQLLVAGRTAELLDGVADMIGAVCGFVLSFLILTAIKRCYGATIEVPTGE